MKNMLMIATLAVALAPSFAAAAQTDKPAANTAAVPAAKPAAPALVMGKKAEPEPVRMAASRAHIDARECLKLETNMAIHSCAEKFR